jgi:hypothetical protein
MVLLGAQELGATVCSTVRTIGTDSWNFVRLNKVNSFIWEESKEKEKAMSDVIWQYPTQIQSHFPAFSFT